MSRIPIARKEAILNKMPFPHPPTVSVLSKQEGISEPTLYNWRKQLRQAGRLNCQHTWATHNHTIFSDRVILQTFKTTCL